MAWRTGVGFGRSVYYLNMLWLYITQTQTHAHTHRHKHTHTHRRDDKRLFVKPGHRLHDARGRRSYTRSLSILSSSSPSSNECVISFGNPRPRNDNRARAYLSRPRHTFDSRVGGGGGDAAILPSFVDIYSYKRCTDKGRTNRMDYNNILYTRIAILVPTPADFFFYPARKSSIAWSTRFYVPLAPSVVYIMYYTVIYAYFDILLHCRLTRVSVCVCVEKYTQSILVPISNYI